MMNWSTWLKAEANRRANASLERTIAVTDNTGGGWSERDGVRMLNLSSNDYLGLSTHPALLDAATRGAARGAGAGSSRLVVGSDSAYRALEDKVAAFKGTERALVIGSGYLANFGTLACLLDRTCGVVSDELNHASIIDGVRLSRATVYRYKHNDVDHLEAQLRAASAAGHERVLVVTDTVFSMDGDLAPLVEIVDLKERYGAALVVDDAHGTGVFGSNGSGLAGAMGIGDRVDLQIGTFSKAFGAYGAYVAGSNAWLQQLVNTSRTLTYSTGLPPAVVETIDASLEIVRAADELRDALQRKASRFRETLRAAGLDTGSSCSQIVPFLVGESEQALALAAQLRERGVLAQAFRPPTVPDGSARIRFSLMASHADDDLSGALETIVQAASATTPP